jgi:hypothetical protein
MHLAVFHFKEGRHGLRISGNLPLGGMERYLFGKIFSKLAASTWLHRIRVKPIKCRYVLSYPKVL